MRLTYDPRYNVAYLALREDQAEVETVQLSDVVNVDLAPDGSVYGIELLNANEQLNLDGHPGFVILNEATGALVQAALPA